MSENNEREAFEAWLATSAKDISGDQWTTENIWLSGYHAALTCPLRERDLAALMHPAVAGMSPAGAIGWLAIELHRALQAGGQPVAYQTPGGGICGSEELAYNGIDPAKCIPLYAAPAPVGEPAALTDSVREALQLAEKTIDILWASHHANRADQALEKIRTLLAAQPAAAAPRFTQADMERFGKAMADAREKRITAEPARADRQEPKDAP